MKYALVYCLALFIFYSCTVERATGIKINNNEVVLKLNTGTTRGELDSIKAVLEAQKGIVIDYSESEFTKENKLKVLKLNVDCGNGIKGRVEASGSALQSKDFGFARFYTKDQPYPFVSGETTEY